MPSEPHRIRDTNERPHAWLVAALLALAIGIVYGPSLAAPFIIDDQTAIVGNPSITSLWPLIGTPQQPGPLRPPQDVPTSARPLVNLSFAVNYKLDGLRPAGYHFVNAFTHFLSALLLWAIVRRTLRLPYFGERFQSSARWLALAAALFGAVHPLVTEAVIYTTQRTELMMALFYLATIYCSLRYCSAFPLPPREGQGEGSLFLAPQAEIQAASAPNPRQRNPHRTTWLVLALLACLAGMASKEVMASVPLIVLLFDRTFISGSLSSALRRSWPLYIGLASTWLLLLFLSLNQPHLGSAGFGLVPIHHWWLTQAQIFWTYLKLTIRPAPLLIHYLPPYLTTIADAWIYVVPVLVLGIVTLVLLWRNTPIGFLATFVFAVLSPTSLVPIPFEIAAERRMYLPLAAIVVLLVVGGYELVERVIVRPLPNVAIATFALSIAIVLGLVSAQRLSKYGNEIILWQNVVATNPKDYIAHDAFGTALVLSNRVPEGMVEIQTALALKPDSPDALNSFGLALMKSERVPEAIENFQAALAQKPNFPRALNNYGAALGMLGRFSESVEPLTRALQLTPSFADARVNLGNALIHAGRLSEAVDELKAALAANPNDPPTRYNCALALVHLNRFPEAIADFEKVLRLQPNDANAHSNLGDVLRKTGQPQQAIGHYEAVLRLKPNDVKAYANLAQSLADADRPKEAVAMAEKAMQVASTTGHEAIAKQIEQWLKLYQAQLQHAGDSQTPSQSSNSTTKSEPK